MATNSGYDCIVTDYRMPNINGLELVKMIRERSDIPIIMFTGYGNELVAAAGIEAGLNGYMRKNSDPSVYSDLASMIRRLVEARRDHPSSTIHT
jgi:CheY-like chemotaxis protein